MSAALPTSSTLSYVRTDEDPLSHLSRTNTRVLQSPPLTNLKTPNSNTPTPTHPLQHTHSNTPRVVASNLPKTTKKTTVETLKLLITMMSHRTSSSETATTTTTTTATATATAGLGADEALQPQLQPQPPRSSSSGSRTSSLQRSLNRHVVPHALELLAGVCQSHVESQQQQQKTTLEALRTLFASPLLRVRPLRLLAVLDSCGSSHHEHAASILRGIVRARCPTVVAVVDFALAILEDEAKWRAG